MCIIDQTDHGISDVADLQHPFTIIMDFDGPGISSWYSHEYAETALAAEKSAQESAACQYNQRFGESRNGYEFRVIAVIPGFVSSLKGDAQPVNVMPSPENEEAGEFQEWIARSVLFEEAAKLLSRLVPSPEGAPPHEFDPAYIRGVSGLLSEFHWRHPSRPPFTRDEVLVTVHVSGHEFVGLGFYQGGVWHMSDGADLGRNIVAWMPKPDPALYIATHEAA